MPNQSCPECHNDGGFCNFCGNKPPNAITGEILQKAGEFANEEQRKIFYKDQDPYEAQGSNLRVHHPVQPKTQVERWEEEIIANEKAIKKCGCCFMNCPNKGTDNCLERDEKNYLLREQILADHEKNKTYINRNTTGTFADDIENAPEYIKKSLFGHNFKKVTLLDKIKLWLKK